MKGSFFFITSDVEFVDFEEAKKKKGARILATFMELDTPSSNKRIYRFVEGKKIAESLVGKLIRFGADWFGKHLKKVPTVGIVEEAFQKGNKIMGIVRIWDEGIIATLKKGTKYLFSVGGVADFGKVVKKGKNLFTKLYNAVCTHLQLLPNDPEGAGFPTAKMHKILEINESVIVTEREFKVCSTDGKCGKNILAHIRSEYEFQEAKRKAVREEAKRKAINKTIAHTILAVMKEPWEFVESED